MTVSDNSGTGVVMQTGGVIVEDSFAAGSNTRGFPSWIITGAGTVVSNLSTNAASYFPYRGSGSGAQLVISNNATMIGGAISLAQQSGGTCTMTIAAVCSRASPVTWSSATAGLTWDDSMLNAMYRGQVGIYTDAAYTYVGIKVTRLAGERGSMFIIR